MPVYAWAGQAIKIRIGSTAVRQMAFRNVGIQRIVVPGWTLLNPTYSSRALHTQVGEGTFVGNGPRFNDGERPGGVLYLSDMDDVDSTAFAIPSGAQQMLLYWKSDLSGVGTPKLTMQALSGGGYATVTNLLLNATVPTDDWHLLFLAIGAFAGSSIKLRLSTNSRVLINNIGCTARMAPGWDVLGDSDAITVPVDAMDPNGTYLVSQSGTGTISVSSSVTSIGVLPTMNSVEGRSVSVSYAFGASSSSTFKVWWVPVVAGVAQTPMQVYSTGASSSADTEFKDARFLVKMYDLPTDGAGDPIQTGYYKVKGTNGARLYQIGDNLAKAQQTEPFRSAVGTGVDSATGNFTWQETDLTVEGGP
ncbi:MAG TPA: hypothetical protein PK691_05125, partial [Thermomicrobiales bacterium]|nr:hypothetical protein [Thermomicrobiales bacterium]